MTLPPSPLADPQVHREEWRRFLVACSMVATMVVEVVLAFTVGFYSAPVWLAVFAVQWYALHRMNRRVAEARRRAFDEWRAALPR